VFVKRSNYEQISWNEYIAHIEHHQQYLIKKEESQKTGFATFFYNLLLKNDKKQAHLKIF
jgi:hypothetical protein